MELIVSEGEIERPDRSGASAACLPDGVAFAWIDGQTRDTFENARPQGQIASMLEVIESLDADPAGLRPLPRPLRHEACPGLALIAADVALHVDHVADTGKGHSLRHTNPPRHKNKRPPAGGTPPTARSDAHQYVVDPMLEHIDSTGRDQSDLRATPCATDRPHSRVRRRGNRGR